ncbi:MAG: VWA domain-containing protein [Terracidiphilus sp.]
MRELILLVILAASVVPAGAARRITVEQLEQTLDAGAAAHRTDTEIARQLGELEVSERITDATLERFARRIAIGPRTALALKLLADQSAFLDPPASELPATATPDVATQERILDMARGYVIETVPHLPNFFVTRTTSRFDNSPQVLREGDWPVRAGLHLVGSKVQQETFRDGKEIADTAAAADTGKVSAEAQKPQPDLGLFSFGEFGPVLAKTLADMSKGNVNWSHWEQTPAGLAAVYSYTVPKAASHFEVQYCCLQEEVPSQHRGLPRGIGRIPGSEAPVATAPANAKPFHVTPGYHGRLLIDPSNGAVLRITLEAELKPDDPITRAAIAVEYGPVLLGDRTTICPVHSLAVSVEPAAGIGGAGVSTPASNKTAGSEWSSSASHADHAPVVLVNESTFTQYHRLGATIRVVADAPEFAAPASDRSTAPAVGPASAGPVTAMPSASAVSGASAPAAPSLEAASAPPAPGPAELATAEPTLPAKPVIPEISLSAANGVPDETASADQVQESSFRFKVTSQLVDVSIMAYDKKGHPVTDLKKEDFEVYDNGRKQEVRFFSQFAGGTVPVPLAEVPPEHTFTNRPANASAAPSATTAPEAGATILLIDESHIAWTDLNNARMEMLKFLNTVAPGERIGLYTISSFGFRVLTEITTDHAALIARLKNFMPTAQSVSQAQDEEIRNRQQFNEVHNVADLNSVNGNHADLPDSASPVDPQLRSLGSNPTRASLLVLGGVARHLSAVPGHKNLIWVSSDNVFAEWEDQAVSTEKGPKSIDSFVLHLQEAMNEAHVAVFPLDVSQLEGGAISADIQHRNVELTQAAQDIASLPGASSANSGGGASAGRNAAPGRVSAEMSQDLHPIQGPIRQVADSTGGRVMRRAGDLAAELSGVVEAGHAVYLLSFTPQGPPDGQYHTIAIRIAGKHPGLALRYRSGYVFEKEPVTLREKFQHAIWSPRDVSEIAVTSMATPMNAGANLKIDITTGDLAFAEQAGRWVDKLDIFLIQRDDTGQHALVDGQSLGLRLKPSTYQSLLDVGVPFERFVRLKPDMASLRVLVVDENSGRIGTVTVPGQALQAVQ